MTDKDKAIMFDKLMNALVPKPKRAKGKKPSKNDRIEARARYFDLKYANK